MRIKPGSCRTPSWLFDPCRGYTWPLNHMNHAHAPWKQFYRLRFRCVSHVIAPNGLIGPCTPWQKGKTSTGPWWTMCRVCTRVLPRPGLRMPGPPPVRSCWSCLACRLCMEMACFLYGAWSGLLSSWFLNFFSYFGVLLDLNWGTGPTKYWSTPN